MRRLGLLVCGLVVSCASPPRSGPVVGGPWVLGPAPGPMAGAPPPGSSPPAPPARRYEVAVLPIRDDEIFRAERIALRDQLAARLVALDPRLTLVPREKVDAALRPVSKTGVPCANDTLDPEDAVKDQGWAYTSLLHVSGVRGASEELWVDVTQYDEQVANFAAPLAAGEPVSAYAGAIARLVPQEERAALLGALGGTPRVAVDGGSLTLCERTSMFQCDANTVAWSDQKAALTACFGDEDEAEEDLLFEVTAGRMTRCELSDVERPEAADSARETCLCNAMAGSSAVARAGGRRRLQMGYLAPSLLGYVRPEVLLSRLSPTLRHDERSHYPLDEERKKGKTPFVFLETAGREELSTSMGRCTPKGGEGYSVLALSIGEAGTVSGVTLVGASGKTEGDCAVKVAKRARFSCPTDGKPASAEVTVRWGAERKADAPLDER